MDTEQAKTLEALQIGIRMEIDGRKFYQEASRKCEIKVGRELFEWLSEQEDWHRKKFEEIYKKIQQNKTWPSVDFTVGQRGEATEIFAKITQSDSCQIKANSLEMDTISKALEIEDKTRVFYKKQGETAVYEAQQKFYKALSQEEQKHYLALVDYQRISYRPGGLVHQSRTSFS